MRNSALRPIGTVIFAMLVAGHAAAVEVPECKGKIQVVRSVRIKPGKEELFHQSMLDLQAWFKNHGKPDTIEIGQQMMQPIGSDRLRYAELSAVIVRSNVSFPLFPDEPATDPQWTIFDKEFSEATQFPAAPVLECIAPLAQ